MSDTLWKNNSGQLVVNDTGQLVLCDTCPCTQTFCNTGNFGCTVSCELVDTDGDTAATNHNSVPLKFCAWIPLRIHPTEEAQGNDKFICGYDLYLSIAGGATSSNSLFYATRNESSTTDYDLVTDICFNATMRNLCVAGNNTILRKLCMTLTHEPKTEAERPDSECNAAPAVINSSTIQCYSTFDGFSHHLSGLQPVPIVPCNRILKTPVGIDPITGSKRKFAFYRYHRVIIPEDDGPSGIDANKWLVSGYDGVTGWKRAAIEYPPGSGIWVAAADDNRLTPAADGTDLSYYGYASILQDGQWDSGRDKWLLGLEGNVYAPMSTLHIGVPAVFVFSGGTIAGTSDLLDPLTLTESYTGQNGFGISVFLLWHDFIADSTTYGASDDDPPDVLTDDQLFYGYIKRTTTITNTAGIPTCEANRGVSAEFV